MLSGSRHHGTVHPPVADRGDGLHIQKVVENVLNKESQTAGRGWWSSSLGVGCGANNSSAQKQTACYEILHRVSDGIFGMT
jgi:hypothetical protein